MKLMLWYALAVNLLLFILMGADKRRARRGQWRIRESTLFLAAFLGGGLGGTLGMCLFHHKTLHRKFRYGFPILALLQLLLMGWMIYRQIA